MMCQKSRQGHLKVKSLFLAGVFYLYSQMKALISDFHEIWRSQKTRMYHTRNDIQQTACNHESNMYNLDRLERILVKSVGFGAADVVFEKSLAGQIVHSESF